MIKDNSTEFLLHTLAAMCIAQYCYASCTEFGEYQWDQSIAVNSIVKELKNRGVNVPQELDFCIKKNDFTGMLNDWGSGNRERGFVMEYIEELYYEA